MIKPVVTKRRNFVENLWIYEQYIVYFEKKQTYTCYTYTTEMYAGILQNYDKRQNLYMYDTNKSLAIESTELI